MYNTAPESTNYENALRCRKRVVYNVWVCALLLLAIPLMARAINNDAVTSVLPALQMLLLDDAQDSDGRDSDMDGVPDDQDAFPNDPNEWQDTDGDGLGDNADPRPNQAEKVIVLYASQSGSSIELEWFTSNPSPCRLLYGLTGLRPVEIRGLAFSFTTPELTESGRYELLLECYDELGNSDFSSPFNVEVSSL